MNPMTENELGDLEDFGYKHDRKKAIEEIRALRTENARLRAALEAAPDPCGPWNNVEDIYHAFFHWYDTVRAEALRGKIEAKGTIPRPKP